MARSDALEGVDDGVAESRAFIFILAVEERREVGEESGRDGGFACGLGAVEDEVGTWGC